MAAIVSQSIEGVNLLQAYAAVDRSTTSTDVDTDENPHPFAYGTQVVATDGSIWVFAKVASSVTSLTQYMTVLIDVDDYADVIGSIGGAAALASARRPGFYQGADNLTAGMAAWFMLSGSPTIRVAIDCEPRVQLYTTDTTGVLDDAVVTGSQYPVRNVFILTSATAAGPFPAIATWPTIAPIGAVN